MKILHLIFVLLLISFPGKSQDKVKRSIPLLKESAKIDSLIFSLINIPINMQSPKNDSCILLGLNSNSVEDFVLGLHATDNRTTIFDLGGSLRQNKNVGYFEFKGYLIFVLGDEIIKKFFNYSRSKKIFRLIKPTTKENLYLIENYMSWAVIYQKEEFYYGVH